MGRNPFEFLEIVYLKTILVISALSFLILILYMISKILFKNKELISDFLIFFCFFVLDIFILQCTLFHDSFIQSYAVAYVLQMLIFCIWKYNILKLFVPVLLCLIFFNVILYLTAIFSAPVSLSSSVSSSSYGDMADKPNIYILILESYQGNEALKKLYDYDNTSFINQLEKKGFSVYQDVYSNAPYTRASLSSVFTIKDLTAITENEIDNLLTYPDKYQTTYTFIKNGYKIEYMFPTDYLTQKDSRCLDDFKTSSLFFQKYFKNISSCTQYQYNSFEDFMDKLQKRLRLKRENPLLFIAKIGGISENETDYRNGVIHIPNQYRHTNKIELLSFLRKKYIDELKKENVLLETLIEEICEWDSNGLIVLIGDHGGDFFEIYDRQYSNHIMPFLNKNNISEKDFLLDFYNILLAIKWPDSIKPREKIQRAPDLFRVIFETLIPNLKIPKVSSQFFDFYAIPLTDIFFERSQ